MSQSRAHSLLESVANIAIGFSVAFASQVVIFPPVGVQASIEQNLLIGAAFTGISLVRSYALRRLFNRYTPDNKRFTHGDMRC